MKVIQSGRQIDSKFRTPANYFSAYVYASHFIFGVHVLRAILILGVLAKFSGVYYSLTPVNGSPGRMG